VLEFIITLPLFFIICIGAIFYFHAQQRQVIDDFSSQALSKSPSLFSTTERQEAQWSQSLETSEEIIIHTADALFSSSKEFKSKNMKEGVFIETKRVQRQKKNCDPQHPSYFIEKERNESAQLSTCAHEFGYNSFETTTNMDISHQKPIIHSFKIDSLYMPQADFRWQARPKMISMQTSLFLGSPLGISFSKQIASLFYPIDTGRFNQSCYMSPFLPECPVIFISSKFERAASDGANAQIAACAVEAATKCAQTSAEGVTYAACVGYKMASIGVSLMKGLQSEECPKLNRVVEESHGISLFKAQEISSFAHGEELELRK
jgi:hypothetical protein